MADWLGYLINPVFRGPEHYSSLIQIAALFGFSLQVYFDFSGYSDIAIGSSKLYGLTIMENFDNPFFAPNISQFWRRWHISLSDWIRDYIFVPLSQKSTSKFWMFVCTPIIAMGICGLWHGAAWHFVIWGIWHGVGIAIWRLWSQFKRQHRSLSKAAEAVWFQYVSVVITFVFVTVGTWWLR